jgi:hypothetical protein
MSLVEVFFANLHYFAIGLAVFLWACLVGFVVRGVIVRYPSYIGYSLQYGMMAWGLWTALKIMGI